MFSESYTSSFPPFSLSLSLSTYVTAWHNILCICSTNKCLMRFCAGRCGWVSLYIIHLRQTDAKKMRKDNNRRVSVFRYTDAHSDVTAIMANEAYRNTYVSRWLGVDNAD